MEKEEIKDQAGEPFTEYRRYTYADYLSWQYDEMVELIKGRLFRNAAAPRRVHQEISGKVFNKLFTFLESLPCKAYAAPFDVRLPVKSKKHEDIDTVVQPDICVVCDPDKLDELGCVGAPDLIIEILSPGNNKKELKYKYEVYEEAGVKEYWIIQPAEQTLLTYTLINGKYVPSRLQTTGDLVECRSLPGFYLDLEYVFRDLD
ncbi:Uma2 family endonuclease [Litoribacter ruber]|uniref:Uma2 family endonuclease n=1 Tax=Litoribacter ruber TaxID=702568 RepID=A0AAP2CGB4_9BACT|nr:MULTISPECIES: Uma2 family endonuclease [Litoribacter]MBS9522656.1 Uma2 family endonuclease [Litoribacter alkaliphilus]MBT0811185.1 Uma2 family endonuclease [Litoribacter ruber]